MDRRDFIKVSGAAAAGVALTSCVPVSSAEARGHFRLTQISSATDTIGQSYLMQTRGGKVIMVDGGYASDVEKLRGHLSGVGNHVDLWLITHPHEDHMEALVTILKDPQEISVDKVVYSRLPDEFLDCEPGSAVEARKYYRVLDDFMDGTDFINVHRAGQRFDIDGVGVMILSVADMSLPVKHFNEQSMISLCARI